MVGWTIGKKWIKGEGEKLTSNKEEISAIEYETKWNSGSCWKR